MDRKIGGVTLKEILENHLDWVKSRGLEGVRANLSCANLRGADLRYADLRDTDLSGADLNGADLNGADLRDANLSYAYLSGAKNMYLPIACPEKGSFYRF